MRAAATLPPGFIETLVASGLESPTNMQFAPDGRLFVLEQTGRVRIIQNGVLLPQPFLTLPVNTVGERGLVGITFDPDFATNQYVYIYYTATSPTIHNRLSRFTANGNIADPDSERILIEFPEVNITIHYGGSMRFGPDGKLYLAVGDDANTALPQNPNDVRGKILRLNSDGTAPEDNPFYNQNTGHAQAVWAIGFRNPYVITFMPGTSRLFINDVGDTSWEEINEGVAGGNYGWPNYEGYTDNVAGRISPLYAYPHNNPNPNAPDYEEQRLAGGCAITGGTFYDPPVENFPEEYVGKYFFADYCRNYIQIYDPDNVTVPPSVTPFAINISNNTVSLEVDRNGSLYYLARGDSPTSGAVLRIDYDPDALPVITQDPTDITVSVDYPATFTCSASGAQPLSYQWQRNNTNIPGATGASYTIASASLADNGANFRCVVTNPFDTATSANAQLTVTSTPPPVAEITTPVMNASYRLGNTVTFSGIGTGAGGVPIPPEDMTWWVDMYHQPLNNDIHTHPVLPQTSGSGGTFTIPLQPHGEDDGVYWYRIHLRVKDVSNVTHEVYRDVTLRPTSMIAPTRNLFLTETPTFTWSRVTWAENYRVEVSTTSSFTGTHIFTETVDSSTLSVTTDPLDDGRYYWRVCAIRANSVRCSRPDLFTVDAS